MNTYSVTEELNRTFGEKGTESRMMAENLAWQEYDAQVLIDARKSVGMTQETLAEKLNTSKSYISKVEHGIIAPSVATFFRMLGVMGYQMELKRSFATI